MFKQAILAIGLTVAATAAHAVSVVNGGFENGSNGAGVFSVPASGPLPGWTIAGGNIEIISSGYWQAAEGSYSIDMNGTSNGWIYQDLTGLTVGAVYQVGFALSSNPGRGMLTYTLGVGAGAATNNFSHTSVDNANKVNDMGWTYHTLDFTAANATERLQFWVVAGGNAAGPALDDVTVELLSAPTQAVPLPAAGLLLAGAVGAMGLARRRRG